MEERGAEQRALFRRWPAGRLRRRRRGRRPPRRADRLVARLALARAAARRHLDRARRRRCTSCCARRASGRRRSSPATRTHLAQHFARSVPPIALWNGIAVREDDPRLLAGAVGWLTARTVDEVRTGDHTFFVGEVLTIEEGARRRRRSSTCTAAYHRAVIEAVVFDLDGVIVDSEQVWDEVREQLHREAGGRYSETATRDMMGMSSPEWSRYMAEELGAARVARGDQRGDRRAHARALRRGAAADRRRGRGRARDRRARCRSRSPRRRTPS